MKVFRDYAEVSEVFLMLSQEELTAMMAAEEKRLGVGSKKTREN